MSRATVSRATVLFVVAVALGAGACRPDAELSDAELYSKYCSKCHGEDGRGDPSLLEGGQKVDLLASRHIASGDREFIHQRIANGYGQMPSYRDKVEPETLQRLVELTMRLIRENTGQRPEDEIPEDGDHGSTTSESRLPEARGAR